MLLLQSNGDFTPLPSPFIRTGGPGLINDWARACTERRVASWQAGSRAGGPVLFSEMCGFVGGTEAIFQLRRHWFTVRPERLGQKSWLKRANRNRGVCVCARAPCLKPAAIQGNITPSPKVFIHLHQPARHAMCTCYCYLYDLIKARQAILAGSGSEALSAFPFLMVPAWPCQEGCMCRWMQMAL